MPNRLPVPPELEHLIEKRENKELRETIRRHSDTETADQGDAVNDEGSTQQGNRLPAEERRQGDERRKIIRRRADAADPPRDAQPQ
jgi:hypothetical protein